MTNTETVKDVACYMLRNKPLLIAGSAARDVAPDKLDRAHEFIRALVTCILDAGGGLVVFAGDEPLTSDGRALIFDWTILRALDSASRTSVTRTVVVTSEKARSRKMSDEQRHLLTRLSAGSAIEMISIPNDVHTGGNIGDEQVERAAGMIALGGGKGVADRARKMQKAGRPVLPFDLSLGALSNDGDGACGLHRQFIEDPMSFFGATGTSLASTLFGLSLETPVLALEQLARRAVTMIASELDAGELQTPDALVLTALPVELGAVRSVLGFNAVAPSSTPGHTQYWTGRVDGRVIAVACFGAAGNVDAAASTTELLNHLKPRAVVMVGIAAGMRDKCCLGEVVLSERIVAYEGAALVARGGETSTSPRPDQYRLAHALKQDLSAYLSDPAAARSRLSALALQVGLVLPEAADAGPVASDPLPRLATVGSGEKLIRDPDRFRALRDLHGKLEVAEMEAVGVANACDRAGTPYLVVRGISDFGDERKDDRFHELAARAAAVVARDFIVCALVFSRSGSSPVVRG